MIDLFVSDIDGCLAAPFEAIDLALWQDLADRIRAAERPDSRWPRFTICSGRPLPYVESVAQALDLRPPALFEAGAGAFLLSEGRTLWNPALTDTIVEEVRAIEEWLIEVCAGESGLTYDHAKRSQAGLIGPDRTAIERLLPGVREHVRTNHPGFRVFETDISIDVVPRAVTKREGFDWLAELTGISLDTMAFIGDTGGDLEALGAVGRSFAPRNAVPRVHEQVSQSTDGAVAEGVLEAYAWCRRHNRSAAGPASS